MNPLYALVVVLAFGLVILFFGFAGLLQRVRALESESVSGTLQRATAAERDAFAALAPQAGASLTAALLVDQGCPSCEQALATFSDRASSDLNGTLTYAVLADFELDLGAAQNVMLVHDYAAHASLHPGWSPAFILIDPDKGPLAIEPAGSPEAIDHLLDRAAAVVRH